MSKASQATALIVVIFSLSFLDVVHCDDVLYVEGKVYCDTCRASFVTLVSQFLNGAKVKLECRNRSEGTITYSKENVTDAQGSYKIPIQGDHEEEICEVVLLNSPRPDCVETLPTHNRARVLVTANSGIPDKSRYANPLGYLAKQTLPDCPKVLKTMGLTPDAMLPSNDRLGSL